jgi:hypothetical protein
MGTEGKTYQLNCLIQGRKDTLAFLIPYDAEVKELKQVIYRLGELEGRFRDLALWKVCKEFHMFVNIHCLANTLVSQVDIELNPLQGLIELKIEDIQGIQEFLSVSSQPLSELWQEQPSLKHLHVFAMVHDKGEMPATSSPSQESACNFHHISIQAYPCDVMEQQSKSLTSMGSRLTRLGSRLNILGNSLTSLENRMNSLRGSLRSWAVDLTASAKSDTAL